MRILGLPAPPAEVQNNSFTQGEGQGDDSEKLQLELDESLIMMVIKN